MLSPATANGHQCIQETTPGSLPSDPELSLVLGGLKSSERKALIQKAVSQFFPLDFPPNAPMDIQRLSGALTNLVFKVTSSLSGQRVLLRVYGTGAEVFVSRSQELAWFIEMSRMGLGPRLLGLFGNGRFEEFLEGVTLTAADLRVPKTFKAIAQALVHLHRLGKPDDSSTIRQNSEMWDRMGSWVKLFESALESLPGHLKERVSQAQLPDVGTLHRDISFLQKSLGPIGTLVFSHNDLQYGNVLSQLPDSGVVLVDYEYAGFNYAEYDIANFFCEWAAGNVFTDSFPCNILRKSYPIAKQTTTRPNRMYSTSSQNTLLILNKRLSFGPTHKLTYHLENWTLLQTQTKKRPSSRLFKNALIALQYVPISFGVFGESFEGLQRVDQLKTLITLAMD